MLIYLNLVYYNRIIIMTIEYKIIKLTKAKWEDKQKEIMNNVSNGTPTNQQYWGGRGRCGFQLPGRCIIRVKK